MKRKILTIALCFALALSCICFAACGEEQPHEKNSAYTFTLITDADGNRGLEVTVARAQDLTYSSELVIPESSFYYKDSEAGETTDHSEAMAVISVKAGAFSGNVSLKAVVIPQYVTSVGDGAFELCTELTSVKIGGKLTKVGKNAFSGCSSLLGIYSSSEEKSKVKSVGDEAFMSCLKLKTLGFEYAQSCSIGDKAFFYGANLPVQDLSNVTYVGHEAFKGCQNTSSYKLSSSSSSWAEDWKG